MTMTPEDAEEFGKRLIALAAAKRLGAPPNFDTDHILTVAALLNQCLTSSTYIQGLEQRDQQLSAVRDPATRKLITLPGIKRIHTITFHERPA